MASKTVASKKQEVININDLTAQQLSQFNQQLEEEVKFLNESVQQLKFLQNQFLKAKETLKVYNPQNDGKEILVPFSTTLYLSGKMKNVGTVRVDVGTGYFIDMTIEQAKSYYDRRNDYIDKQVQTVKPNLVEKNEMKKKIMEVLTVKISELLKNVEAPKVEH